MDNLRIELFDSVQEQFPNFSNWMVEHLPYACLLYTSDAADDLTQV